MNHEKGKQEGGRSQSVPLPLEHYEREPRSQSREKRTKANRLNQPWGDPEEYDFAFSLASELRRRRLEMLDRDNRMFAPISTTSHEQQEVQPRGPVLGVAAAPQDVTPKKQEWSFIQFSGRTKGLIGTLLFWSLVLPFFGIVLVIYPIMCGVMDYGLIIRPNFDSIRSADDLLRIASILGQWNIPAQTLHFFFGPGGSLLAGFIGLTLSCRELGLVTNRERYHRTHNPFNHASIVCLLAQSGHSISLSGYWSIYRLAPPSVSGCLLLFSRILPYILAMILTMKISAEFEIVEIFMPFSVICSTFGIALSLIFVFFIHDLSEVLPADSYYCRAFFKPDPVAIHIKQILFSRFIWLHILALAWLFGFQHFWIANIPGIQHTLKAPIPTNESYLIFLGGDFLGRYVLPFLLDWIVCSEFSRFDLQIILLLPYILCNLFAALPIFSSKLTIFFILLLSIPNALMTVYLLASMRATIDNFYLPFLLNISQTLSILLALVLDFICSQISPIAGLYSHLGISIITALFLLTLWISCREYETDRYGFCSAGLFSPGDRFHVSSTYIPTAMVPLWVTSMREQEKIQQNYYKWNTMRQPPSLLARKNAQYADWLKKRRHREKERMREVEERVEY